jgi:putative transposon-encoded protein
MMIVSVNKCWNNYFKDPPRTHEYLFTNIIVRLLADKGMAFIGAGAILDVPKEVIGLAFIFRMIVAGELA